VTVVVALEFALFDVVVVAVVVVPAVRLQAMSVYFTCKQIAVPSGAFGVCLVLHPAKTWTVLLYTCCVSISMTEHLSTRAMCNVQSNVVECDLPKCLQRSASLSMLSGTLQT